MSMLAEGDIGIPEDNGLDWDYSLVVDMDGTAGD